MSRILGFGSIRRARRALTLSVATAMAAGLSPAAAPAQEPLIIALVGFPCGFNDFASDMCGGFAAGAKELGEQFTVEVRTGVDYADQTAFNNLIETSLQLRPSGIIVFPGGPAAQVAVLRRACEANVKVVIIDNPVEGLGACQSAYVAADHRGLGESLGNWLVANPPVSKEVGIVTLPPGQYASNDARVTGFTETVEAAGYTVVATAVTDLTLDKTRTLATNMLAAHPGLGAVMSANGAMADGTAQAVDKPEITQLALDGTDASLERMLRGERRADALQDPYGMGRLAVINMGRLLLGEPVPAEITTESRVLDATTVGVYLAESGKQLN